MGYKDIITGMLVFANGLARVTTFLHSYSSEDFDSLDVCDHSMLVHKALNHVQFDNREETNRAQSMLLFLIVKGIVKVG